QSIVLVLCPAILDRRGLALDIAAFPQAAQECGQKVSPADRRGAAQQPDDWHRLLCTRRQRPCRRTADERDEVAALHSITSSASGSSLSGMVRPSALAVLRFRNIWTFVDC